MAEAYLVEAATAQALADMYRRVQNREQNRPADEFRRGRERNYVYVAKAPPAGIDAINGDTPGKASCELYRLDPSSGDLTAVTGLPGNPAGAVSRTIHNMAGEVAAGAWIQVNRDAFGIWWVHVENCGAGGTTITEATTTVDVPI